MSLSTSGWFLLLGLLMLASGMASPLIRRIPVTPAILYLAIGVLLGPTVLGWFHFNPLKQSAFLEILTEVVVLISLFSAGVKMPVPVSWVRWRSPVLLASVSMVVSVFLVACFAHYALDLSWGAAVLLGAVIAPTDPVLATEVQTRHPGDRDRLRFTLTCEAGMNDGSAFPFVMLGLGILGYHELGTFGWHWAVEDVLWATSAGIVIGVLSGWALGHLAVRVRRAHHGVTLLSDFLGLGLIGTVYGLSLLLSAWGFLAVFFAAVALRQTEVHLTGGEPETGRRLYSAGNSEQPLHPQTQRVSEGSLVFKEHLERLSELVLILLLGGMLFVDSWSWRSIALALFVFLVARPLSVWTGLIGSHKTFQFKSLIGWFGVRGIGSLFYLMYAVQHGIGEDLAVELIHLTLVVVTLSIIIHGISVKPMLGRLWKRTASDRPNPETLEHAG